MSYLKDLNYSALALPSATLTPGTVLVKQDGKLVLPSPLDSVFAQGDAAAPMVSPDVPGPSIEGDRARAFKLNIGLSILGTFIKALGGNLGFGFQYDRAKTVKLSFKEVKRNFLGRPDAQGVLREDAAALDRFLDDADFKAVGTIRDEMRQGDLYLVLDTIKSNKIAVVGTDKNGNEIHVDVPTVGGAVGGNIKVGSGNQSSTQIIYEGSTALVFGCKVVRVVFENNKFRRVESQIMPVAAAAIGGGAPADDSPEVFTSGGVVVAIG